MFGKALDLLHVVVSLVSTRSRVLKVTVRLMPAGTRNTVSLVSTRSRVLKDSGAPWSDPSDPVSLVSTRSRVLKAADRYGVGWTTVCFTGIDPQ